MAEPGTTLRPSGPDPADWIVALLRGLHPARWLLCLAGLAITTVLLALSQSLFDAEAPRVPAWFQSPAEQAETFSREIGNHSFSAIVLRLGLVLSLLAAIWCPIGCWIARHECNSRRRGQDYAVESPVRTGPTTLVLDRLKSLLTCCPMVLILATIFMLPVGIAGLVNNAAGGPGAILVAILLPIVIVGNLLVLCMVLGLLAAPLMPVTIAVEESDMFDALSRSYNYSFQRPIHFLVLLLASLVLAAMPLSATLYLLAGPIQNWPGAAGHVAVFVAAALSISIFWSLQTLAYLHLRTAIDDVDANEIPSAKPVIQKPKPAEGDPSTPTTIAQQLWSTIQAAALLAATWFVTVWLFGRIGGANAGWLAWGMGEKFAPDAEGLYFIAALIGGFWGALCLTAPLVVTARRMLRSSAKPSDSTQLADAK